MTNIKKRKPIVAGASVRYQNMIHIVGTVRVSLIYLHCGETVPTGGRAATYKTPTCLACIGRAS